MVLGLYGLLKDFQIAVNRIRQLFVVLVIGLITVPFGFSLISPGIWIKPIAEVWIIHLFPAQHIFEPKGDTVYLSVVAVQNRQLQSLIFVRSTAGGKLDLGPVKITSMLCPFHDKDRRENGFVGDGLG